MLFAKRYVVLLAEKFLHHHKVLLLLAIALNIGGGVGEKVTMALWLAHETACLVVEDRPAHMSSHYLNYFHR